MKKILSLLLLSIFLTACDDDAVIFPDSLSGEWSLVKVMENNNEGIIEIPEDDIIWNFNTETNTVIIANNSPDHPEIAVADGTYTFTLYDNPVQGSGWNHKIDIDGVTGFFYDRSGIHLQFSDGQANGYHYDFIRPISPE